MSINSALRITFALAVVAIIADCRMARCQIVSFSPQGAEVLSSLVGRTIPGVAAMDVEVCSKTDAKISSGLVYQAAVAAGIQPVSPLAIDALVSSELGRNRWRLLSSGLNLTAHTGTVLLASEIIASSGGWTAGFAVASGLMDTLADRFRARIPTFGWRKDLLEGDLAVSAGGCVNKLMYARYSKALTARMADLGTPKVVERPIIEERSPKTEPILTAMADLERILERKR